MLVIFHLFHQTSTVNLQKPKNQTPAESLQNPCLLLQLPVTAAALETRQDTIGPPIVRTRSARLSFEIDLVPAMKSHFESCPTSFTSSGMEANTRGNNFVITYFSSPSPALSSSSSE
ncbi:hypothetical protein COP1_000742 [Malus domestica]